MTTPQPYNPPQLTKAQELSAVVLVSRLTANKSTAVIRAAFARLVCENMRLALEVNEHRAARGFEPLTLVEE